MAWLIRCSLHNVKTWVQAPSTHMKSPVWWPTLGSSHAEGVETGESQGFADQLSSSLGEFCTHSCAPSQAHTHPESHEIKATVF